MARLLLALLGLLPASLAGAACDPAGIPPTVSPPLEQWLESLPEDVSESLDRRGYAFPEAGFVPGCPEMIPAILSLDSSADRVFSLLTQTERHGEFLRVGLVSPVSRPPADRVDRYEMKILFTRIVYYVRHHWQASSRRIWWDLSPDHPNDLRSVVGFWEIHPLAEDRSIAVYATHVDVGPVIPRRLQRSLTTKNMRSIVGNVRGWIASQEEAPR